MSEEEILEALKYMKRQEELFENIYPLIDKKDSSKEVIKQYDFEQFPVFVRCPHCGRVCICTHVYNDEGYYTCIGKCEQLFTFTKEDFK